MQTNEEPDLDRMYEEWIDRWVDKLENDLNDLYKFFVLTKGTFYSGRPEKFKRHLRAMIDVLEDDSKVEENNGDKTGNYTGKKN